MSSLPAKACRRATVFLGALGFAAIGSSLTALAQEQPPEGWFKACTKQDEVDICNVQFTARAETGQILTSVNLIEVKGKVNRRMLQIAVPTGRAIPPGVGLQIDAGGTQKVDYAVCLPDRCVAEAQLTDEVVNSFKRGSSLTLTSVNFQQQANPIKVTLQGFTGAYDGEPLRQEDLVERERKVNEYVSKNNEELAKRLKEAQEQAKQQ